MDLRDRDRLFGALGGRPFDLAVIGGGITGAGIARDAALRGLRVALLEARDFAAGTSSRSTKLVHGGIRYLLQGDLALVREAARDRQIIARLAPHLARRTLFVVPARSRWALLWLRLGLTLYERIGAIDKADRHQVWHRHRIAAEEPALHLDGIHGAVAYPEYITDDARLTLANVRSAETAGAVVANYAEVTAIEPGAGGADTALCVVDRTGTSARQARLRARAVVNAAGPWADSVRRLEDPHARAALMLTRGIHIVVPRTRLPGRHITNLKAADGRGLFAIPRGDMVYLGTTDTFYRRPDYWPEIEAADVDYLLAAANAAFDIDPLSPADIVNAWAGLRPLLAQPDRAPSEISRRDEIMEGTGGMITIAGGKLTAFRRMAERVVDHCQRRLAVPVSPCRTADAPLPGGDFGGPVDALIGDVAAALHDRAQAERLVLLYGSEAHDIVDAGADVAAEARRAILCEGALTLEDYWVRRSARARFDPDGGTAALATAAQTMAPLLGWDDLETAQQITACRALRQQEMAAIHGRCTPA